MGTSTDPITHLSKLEVSDAPIFCPYGAGTKAGTGVTVEEYGDGVLHKTVLTLSGYTQAMTDNGANASGGTKIYDFPEGAITILGAVVSLALTTNMGATSDMVGGLGTATAAADGTLSGTEQDIVPSTALSFSSSAVAFHAIHATAGTSAAQGIASLFDGTTTAVDLYLNFADGHDTGGTGKYVGATGTITLTWLFLGDH